MSPYSRNPAISVPMMSFLKPSVLPSTGWPRGPGGTRPFVVAAISARRLSRAAVSGGRPLASDDLGPRGGKGLELRRRVDGGRVRLHPEDLLDEPAEDATRSELQVGRAARVVEGLDALDPADRAGDLRDQGLPHVVRGGHEAAERVRRERDVGIAPLDVLHRLGDLGLSGLHQLAVEGRADLDPDDLLRTGVPRERHCALDAVDLA